MKHFPRRQKGAVLALGLIFLAVASIVSIASMRASSVQEKITSNQRNKTISLMAAEYGAGQLVKAIVSSQPLPSQNLDFDINGLGVGDTKWRYSASGGGYIVTGRVLSGSDEFSRSVLEVSIRGSGSEFPSVGLLADKSVQISGSAVMKGDAHSNQDFRVTGQGVGNFLGIANKISAVGGIVFNGKGVESESKESGADKVDLDFIVGKVSAEKNYGSVFEGGKFVSCAQLPSDLNGRVYYCNGDINLSGYSNGVVYVNGSVSVAGGLRSLSIIASGDFLHTGAGDLGVNADTQVFIAAAGNIIFNGGGNLSIYGSLWADGNIERNGSGDSVFVGSAVTYGEQIWNGHLNFTERGGRRPPVDNGGWRIEKWLERG